MSKISKHFIDGDVSKAVKKTFWSERHPCKSDLDGRTVWPQKMPATRSTVFSHLYNGRTASLLGWILRVILVTSMNLSQNTHQNWCQHGHLKSMSGLIQQVHAACVKGEFKHRVRECSEKAYCAPSLVTTRTTRGIPKRVNACPSSLVRVFLGHQGFDDCCGVESRRRPTPQHLMAKLAENIGSPSESPRNPDQNLSRESSVHKR